MPIKLEPVDPMSFIPLRYEDLRSPVPSNEFREGTRILASGTPVDIHIKPTEKGSMMTVTLKDESGYFFVKFFRFTKYHEMMLRKNKEIYIFGEPKLEPNGWAFYHPEFPDGIGKILPIYKCPKGVGQKKMRQHVWRKTKNILSKIEDEVPLDVLKQKSLPSIADALRMIHFPDGSTPDETPLIRLAYRELVELRKKIGEYPKQPAPKMRADLAAFLKKLPFELTNDQKKAVNEIALDMTLGIGMRRLCQGDVGSGKTVVAQAAAHICLESGYRTLVLAPTVVLAGQLFESFRNVFGEHVSSFTGEVKDNPSMIIVGTHALLNKFFPGTGLVIMDEQQRFGVSQRNRLLGPVHALQLSATPIPRTISLLFHKAIKLSTLRTSPYKRDVVTRVVPPEEKSKILGHIRQTVNNGGKVLVIYPLVEEDKGNYKSVEKIKDVWEKLYPGKVMWVHGRIEDKLDIVNEFRKSTVKKILVASCLIEVGVDVPEASLLVVAGGEKFGISSLHQLRGRIGRRGNKSYCYFMYKNPDSLKRLKPLETMTDGFKIAEIDSDLRGWGDAFGEEQKGHLFKLPSIDYYKKAAQLISEQ